MFARPQDWIGVCQNLWDLNSDDCANMARLREKSFGESKVRLRDLQAMVSIMLLLMSGSTQPALAQAGVAPTGTAQQSNPTAPVTQPPTGSDQNSLPPTPAPKL